jgi:enoyl-CoA hydratase/carnithine racemase
MNQAPTHFRWEQRGAVGRITLDRPGRKNALTFESYAELRRFLEEIGRDSSIRALVLGGANGDFCSGGDVHEIIAPLLERPMPELLAFTRMTGDVVKAMRLCPQPIVAAVDGVCVGAGAALAMAADIRLGTPRSRTAFLFTRVGLAGCDMGACAMLPRIIGQGRASELLMTGRSMNAVEGASWGFFNRLCEPAELEAAALALAEELGAGPSFALGLTKTQLNQEWDMNLFAAIEAEAQAQAICMQTQDFRRAYRAFIAKAKVQFEGD